MKIFKVINIYSAYDLETLHAYAFISQFDSKFKMFIRNGWAVKCFINSGKVIMEVLVREGKDYCPDTKFLETNLKESDLILLGHKIKNQKTKS